MAITRNQSKLTGAAKKLKSPAPKSNPKTKGNQGKKTKHMVKSTKVKSREGAKEASAVIAKTLNELADNTAAPGPEPRKGKGATLLEINSKKGLEAAAVEAVEESASRFPIPTVGSTITVAPESLNADPTRNGRPINMGKVKDYARDFGARIAAGLDPQLQEISVYFDASLPGDEAQRPQVEFGFHRVLAAILYNKTPAGLEAAMGMRCRVGPTPEGAQGLLNNYAENHHHASLDPVADMRYMVRLRDEHKLSQREIAKRMGVSAGFVSERMQLELLTPATLEMVIQGTIPVKGAYALAAMGDEGQREKAVEKIVGVMSALDSQEGIAAVKVPKLDVVKAAIDAAEGREPATIPVKAHTRTPAGTTDAGGTPVQSIIPGMETAPSPVKVQSPVKPLHNAQPQPPGPQPLTGDQMQLELQKAASYDGCPLPLKAVLRNVLQWRMGLKTTKAMLSGIGRQMGFELPGKDMMKMLVEED